MKGQDIQKMFSLPSYTKGKTFAEASKLIERKFKDRTDITSMKTKEELQARLAKSQEYVKMQEALANNASQVPDNMDGEVPAGMEDYVNQSGDGELLEDQFGINPEAQAKLDGNYGPDLSAQTATPQMSNKEMAGGSPGVGSYTGAATAAYDMASSAFGKTGINTAGGNEEKLEKVDKAGATLKGVSKGAKAGMAFGPWGAAIGGVVGGVTSFIGAGKANADIETSNSMKVIADSAKIRQSDFAYGGKMTNKYEGGTGGKNPLIDYGKLDDILGTKNKLEDIDASAYGATQLDYSGVRDSAKPFGETTVGKGVDWLGKNSSNIAQYAPVASSIIGLKNLKPSTTARPNKIDSIYKPGRYDNEALVNQINQQNIERSLTESSGGDIGALRSNLLAAGAVKLRALGEGRRAQEDKNISEDRIAFQAGRQKDIFNARQEERYIERAARDKGAFESTKGEFNRAIAEDVGAIGREEVDKKLVRDMFGYKWNGKYYVDNKGVKHTTKEVRAKLKEAEKAKADTNEGMFGGYLKKK